MDDITLSEQSQDKLADIAIRYYPEIIRWKYG